MVEGVRLGGLNLVICGVATLQDPNSEDRTHLGKGVQRKDKKEVQQIGT